MAFKLCEWDVVSTKVSITLLRYCGTVAYSSTGYFFLCVDKADLSFRLCLAARAPFFWGQQSIAGQKRIAWACRCLRGSCSCWASSLLTQLACSAACEEAEPPLAASAQ